MVNQIFKQLIPYEIIEYFLIKNCVKEKETYIFNKCCYKRILLNKECYQFLEKIKSYYHVSKQYYINRPINYTRFMTIIRQLCKSVNIIINSSIKYNSSSYETIYHVYFTR